MSPDVFQLTILEMWRGDNSTEMRTLVLEELSQSRGTARHALKEMIGDVSDGLRRRLFDLMLADGGKDMLPLLLKILSLEPVDGVVEQKLAALANFKHPEAIEALEGFEPYLPPSLEPAFNRALSKLRARFAEFQNMRAFRDARGEELKELAETMARNPHVAYTPFLNRYLGGRDLERIGAAVRVLRTVGDATSLEAMLVTVGNMIKHRRHTLAFLELPVMQEGYRSPKPIDLFKMIDECPLVHWTPAEKETLNAGIQKGVSIGKDLVVPFGFEGETQAMAAAYLNAACGEEGYIDPTPLRTELLKRVASIRKTLEGLFQAMGRIARRTKNPRFAQRLRHFLPPEEPDRNHILAWGLAGLGDEPARDELLKQLDVSKNRSLKLTLLAALNKFRLDDVPHQIMDIARQVDDSEMRRAAISIIAGADTAAVHFEKLLSSSPMLVRADVGKEIADRKIKSCYPMVMGFLHRRVTDSFRAIILEALSAFDNEEIGMAVQQYALPPHPLSVRVAALNTLLKSRGEGKLDLVFETLIQGADRHAEELALSFLEILKDWPIPEREADLLTHLNYWEPMLRSQNQDLRLGLIKMLERCEWLDDSRDGWVNTLQRALNTLTGQRSDREIERIRGLIETLSARFESERKAQQLRAQFDEVVRGMEQTSRIAKLQALRKLDWIFRPEMLTGDTDAVRRMVSQIERFLDSNLEDSDLEILAIEVAGKIGHPFLRRKLRHYLDNENPAVAAAAKQALSRPVNRVLLENLIQTVFSMDDSSYMTRTVTMILNAANYKAEGHNDCEEALDILDEKTFDLLILDLNMPQMRGVDFLRESRKRGVCPRFVFILTSVRTQEDLIEVFKEGVDGIILKPFRSEDLLEKISELKEKCA
ncbi:MAG: response regulator [Acidobacteriota bacterium]|nr:response regulator [Acidobacteriota bacterium]